MKMIELQQTEFVRSFIALYRSYPCLWKTNNRKYNRPEREKAYCELLKFYQKYDEAATRESVRNKISNLRSTFRKELKKVHTSQLTGATASGVYTPSLWYYDLLLFTHEDQEKEFETETICNDVFEICDSNGLNSSRSIKEEVHNVDDNSSRAESPVQHIILNEATSTKDIPHSKRKRNEDNVDVIESAQEDSVTNDEGDAIGTLVACKLRRMDATQRIIAEKIIYRTLIDGELNRLRI